ncbi:septum site-determining protein DivIVA [Ruminiclostridium hungatei]|uniref:Septum site-determining protein DivIVA n=1 Tax=Ruminiclostridium hungatei TaxID=48256 RepID=A0A1V4SEY0_RUMHU|nr:DivIVA domain-containing protein [Ruminiclostridium hungatei]OPX42400.1 septum site-determining protein DivIVA [Ruminiclostridium hungatei]
MNYTPEELRSICLKRSFLDGYSRKQVNNLLALINDDYSRVMKENEEMRTKINSLNEAIQHYKMLEESLQHSILVAQHTSEQIKVNACEKARLITSEAEANATKIIEAANQEIVRAKGKLEEIKAEIFTLKTKTELLLQAQMEVLKQISID